MLGMFNGLLVCLRTAWLYSQRRTVLLLVLWSDPGCLFDSGFNCFQTALMQTINGRWAGGVMSVALSLFRLVQIILVGTWASGAIAAAAGGVASISQGTKPHQRWYDGGSLALPCHCDGAGPINTTNRPRCSDDRYSATTGIALTICQLTADLRT